MNVKMFIPLLCTYLLATNNLFAQQFVNGGFEPVTTIAPCKDMDVKVYNHNMGSNWSVGTATTMQIANSTCGAGNSVSGSYFGILKYAPPSDGNIIVFKLDKQLTANKPYSFSLSYKIPASMSTVNGGLRYGYSNDSTNADSTSGATDAITNTSWKKDTITFTPKKACQYVWIEVAALGGDPFEVDVDDVKMIGTTTSVNDLEKFASITVSPNPFTDHAVLKIDMRTIRSYSIVLYDLAGRVVLQKSNLSDGNLRIDSPSSASGMYILKLTDDQEHTYLTRLFAQ